MKRCAIFFLVISSCAAAGRAAEPALALLESGVLRVRMTPPAENFAAQLRAAETTNHVSGVVLDLRFADSVATNAADFLTREKTPLVILVDSQTRGAAAALAAQLRAAASAIVIGSTNPPGNVLPDIAVATSLEDEKKFQENPFWKAPVNLPGALSDTNNLIGFVDHTSEAELVRKRIKDGEDDNGPATPRAEPTQPVVRDPALARAVDLLKALAVLRPERGKAS
jgi:hypothetical protein